MSFFDSLLQLDGNFLIGIQHALNADWLTPIMKSITMLANGGCFWIAMCLLLLVFKRTRRLGIICTCSLLLTYICCNLIIKPAVNRTRPWIALEAVHAFLPPPGDSSFPSGHSANSMGPAWALFIASLPVRTRVRREDGSSYLLKDYNAVTCLGWKGDGVSARTAHRFSIAAVVLALLIGVTRLYLGMHYPSDVVCGWLLGMICATVVYSVILAVERRKGVIGSGGARAGAKESGTQER